MDAAGGGGWGPIGTPALLASNRLEPRKVVGSIDTSELVVAVGASAGFLFALSLREIGLGVVAALLVAGVIAAPIAAYVVRILPPALLGTAVGGLIMITNAQTLGKAIGVPDGALPVAYVTIALVWAAALASSISLVRSRRPAMMAAR